jgi:5-methylcytosine-specific restriction endonuclease McrA
MTRPRSVEFPAKVRQAAFARANGHCEGCPAFLYTGRYHYDHIIPAALGGEPTLANCQVLCTACHGEKTAGEDVPRIAKAVRQHRRHIGAKVSARPMPGSRASKWRKRMNGTTERRP